MNSSTLQPPAAGDRLKTREYIGYALGDTASNFFFQTFNISDEASAPGQPNFTGAFVGMACQDLAGTLRPADFDFFEYRQRSYRADPFSASSG
jgi:xylan 1,4-beta-xylosidase